MPSYISLVLPNAVMEVRNLALETSRLAPLRHNQVFVDREVAYLLDTLIHSALVFYHSASYSSRTYRSLSLVE